jgi:hypothetical protein
MVARRARCAGGGRAGGSTATMRPARSPCCCAAFPCAAGSGTARDEGGALPANGGGPRHGQTDDRERPERPTTMATGRRAGAPGRAVG